MTSDYRGLKKWMPMVTLPAGLEKFGKIRVNGLVNGTLSDLSVPQLNIGTENGTRLNSKISVKGLPDMRNLSYHITFDSLHTRYNNWTGFLSDRDPIQPLESLGGVFYSGTLSGNQNELILKGEWSTELGRMESAVDMKMESFKPTTYRAAFNVFDWNVAPLFPDSIPVNHFSGSVIIDGAGVKIPDMHVDIIASVDSVAIKDYLYQDLLVEAKWQDQKLDTKFSISDPNLNIYGKGQFDLADSIPLWLLSFSCDTFLPHHLNLTKSPFYFKGKALAQIRGKTMETMTGKVISYDLSLANDSMNYRIDSVTLARSDFGDEHLVSLVSGNQMATLSGKFSFDDLPKIITHFNNKFQPDLLRASDQDTTGYYPDRTIDNPFQVEVHASFTDLDTILHLFKPQWLGLDSIVLDGRWDNEMQEWDLSGTAGTVKHAKGSFEKLSFHGSGLNDTARFTMQIDSLLFHGQEDYFNVTWTSNLKRDSLKSHFLWENHDKEKMIDISPILHSSGDRHQVTFEDTMWLANKSWTFSLPHQILWGKDYLFFDQIELARGDRRIRLESQSIRNESAEHLLTLRDFPLGDISSILDLTDAQFTGKASGTLKVQDVRDDLVFTTNLNLDQLEYNQQPVGNFDMNAALLGEHETVSIQARLSGANAFQASGDFYPGLKTANLRFSIDSIQCKLLESFTVPYLQEISGSLKGYAHLSGALSSPELDAEISLIQVSSFINYLKGYYHIPKHTIRLTQNEIDFGDMVLFDAINRPARFGGRIVYDHFQHPEFDLNFETDHFQFLNTNSEDNNLFYGKLFLGMTMQLRGGIHLPVAKINAVTLPETDIYFVSPSTEEVAIEKADYIIYGKPDDIETGSSNDTFFASKKYIAGTSGIDLFLNLEVNPQSSVTIILDPETGDKLTCQGEAQISVDKDASGSFQVKGNYVVKTGEYQLNYENIFKRNFKIHPNSEMIFTGDPMDTQLKISATYTSKTNLVDLIKHEAVLSSEESFLASQRRDVNVIMHLSGSLRTPKITFDIQLADQRQDAVYTAAASKLEQLREQESELNTQVFGLLLFNSFVGMDRSSTSLTQRGEAIVLSSVSNFLTGQLNRLADRIGGGINLRFDVDSYQGGRYDQANVTQVQLGLTKQIFNNRLSIDVGGNLDVYSHKGGSIADFTTLAGDFVLNYLLNENGNYRLKVFRRSNFDIISDSNVHKTGVGISFNKAFQRKRKKKAE
jgi:hypothetical protein